MAVEGVSLPDGFVQAAKAAFLSWPPRTFSADVPTLSPACEEVFTNMDEFGVCLMGWFLLGVHWQHTGETCYAGWRADALAVLDAPDTGGVAGADHRCTARIALSGGPQCVSVGGAARPVRPGKPWPECLVRLLTCLQFVRHLLSSSQAATLHLSTFRTTLLAFSQPWG